MSGLTFSTKVHLGFLACAIALTTGCARREEILPGERLDLRAPLVAQTDDAAAEGEEATETDVAAVDAADEEPPVVADPLVLATASINPSWTHRNGSVGHSIPHPQLGAAPVRVWTQNIGSGNSRKQAITSDPVIADGRVFAMDSRAKVSGYTTEGGSLWTVDLTPANEKAGEISGGGLGYGGGQLFATTGHGEVIAINPETGTIDWRHKVRAPIPAAPVVVGDTVVAVTRSNTAIGLNTSNGRIRWEQSSAGDQAGILGAGAPAAAGGMAILPFASGEIVGAVARNGLRAWSSAVSGSNRGFARSIVSDISSDPVVHGTNVYVANQSGRLAALDRRSGERLWTVKDGSYSPVWAVNGGVFVITDQFSLKRLNQSDGGEVWSVDLPGYKRERPRRIRSAHAYFGPTLAGGQLWVASSSGDMTAYDPETGDLVQTINIPGGAASQPAIAGGRMFILSGNGQLHAFQ